MDNLDDLAFDDLLWWWCRTKLNLRSSVDLAKFMTDRGHRTIQQSANRYLNAKTTPNPAWVKDFMRFAGLDSKERRTLFNAYVASDPELQALLICGLLWKTAKIWAEDEPPPENVLKAFQEKSS